MRFVPHSAQNFAPGVVGEPHVGQEVARRVPHSAQNLAEDAFSDPQVLQFMGSGQRSRLSEPCNPVRTAIRRVDGDVSRTVPVHERPFELGERANDNWHRNP
jgi:hypothetical protein